MMTCRRRLWKVILRRKREIFPTYTTYYSLFYYFAHTKKFNNQLYILEQFNLIYVTFVKYFVYRFRQITGHYRDDCLSDKQHIS